MTLVEAPPSDTMRVILCLKFDPRAPFDEVANFKRTLLACPEVVNSVEVSGSFDFMLEAGLANFASYQAMLERFAEPLAALVERHEANFICRRFTRASEQDHALWVPVRDGRKRIDTHKIDLVRAEGDYVRVHCGEQSWLLHDTMHHVREMLDGEDFIMLHRSTIAAMSFIRKLIHREHYWVALLANGEQQRIAKSKLAAVLAALRSEPKMDGAVTAGPAAFPQIRPLREPMTVAATPSATAMP